MRKSSKFSTNWDVFIIIITLLYAIFMPFQTAFNPDQELQLQFRLFLILINIFFILDLVVNFRTTFVDTKTGVEVFEPNKIARRYIFGGRFFIDLLASIPMDFFSN